MNTKLEPNSLEASATASFFLFDEVQCGSNIGSNHGQSTHVATNPGIHPNGVNPIAASKTNKFSTPSSRWEALVSRDPNAKEAFIYAVRTTGIYCRPDCSARLARRANIDFFDDARQAEAAGYRPCKRCKPDRSLRASQSAQGQEPNMNGDSPPYPCDPDDVQTKIYNAVQLIRHSASRGVQLSLSQISKEVGLSKWHLQRVFKKLQGMTPREMAEQIQREGQQNPTNEATKHDSCMLDSGNDWMNSEFDSDFDFNASDDCLAGKMEYASPHSISTAESAQTPSSWGEELFVSSTDIIPSDLLGPDIDVDLPLCDIFPDLYKDGRLITQPLKNPNGE